MTENPADVADFELTNALVATGRAAACGYNDPHETVLRTDEIVRLGEAVAILSSVRGALRARAVMRVAR